MPNPLRTLKSAWTTFKKRLACALQFGHVWDFHIVTPYQPHTTVTATYRCVVCGTTTVSTFHPATKKEEKK